ncbi:hypothetical protein BS78_04G182700 [Paspalum vaginatum]|nr:hypothetical protein BS78_04G182700 [Paspalum vaginatum]
MKSSAAAGDVDVELLKAVAHAWHAQLGNPRPSRASEAGGDADPRRRRAPPRGRGAAPAVPVQAGGDGGGGVGRPGAREALGLRAVAVGPVRARQRGAEARVRPRHRRPRRRRAAGGRRRAWGGGEAAQGERPQPEETVASLHLRGGSKNQRALLSAGFPAARSSSGSRGREDAES